MSGGLASEGQDARVGHARSELADMLTDFTADQIEAHAARGYPPYWLAFDTATHARHARLMRDADEKGTPITIESRIDHYRAVTEVTIYASDHPGLFSRIAGAIALSGADIVDAKIFTTVDGMAIDTFWIQDPNGGAYDGAERLTRMSARIEQTMAGSLRPTQELAKKIQSQSKSRTRVFTVQPRAFLDNEASLTHTVVEVSGRDRPGLLHELTRTLTGLNLQIASAHVSTYGETAVDVFYVKDVFGLKVTHEDKITQIREALMAALWDEAEAAEKAPESTAAE
jgi:[protein-PII] uridylyltransferase